MPCVTRQLLNILDLLKIVKTFPFIKKTGFKILKYLPASYNKITMFLMPMAPMAKHHEGYVNLLPIMAGLCLKHKAKSHTRYT